MPDFTRLNFRKNLFVNFLCQEVAERVAELVHASVVQYRSRPQPALWKIGASAPAMACAAFTKTERTMQLSKGHPFRRKNKQSSHAGRSSRLRHQKRIFSIRLGLEQFHHARSAATNPEFSAS
jgi:hypothetical protein